MEKYFQSIRTINAVKGKIKEYLSDLNKVEELDDYICSISLNGVLMDKYYIYYNENNLDNPYNLEIKNGTPTNIATYELGNIEDILVKISEEEGFSGDTSFLDQDINLIIERVEPIEGKLEEMIPLLDNTNNEEIILSYIDKQFSTLDFIIFKTEGKEVFDKKDEYSLEIKYTDEAGQYFTRYKLEDIVEEINFELTKIKKER